MSQEVDCVAINKIDYQFTSSMPKPTSDHRDMSDSPYPVLFESNFTRNTSMERFYSENLQFVEQDDILSGEVIKNMEKGVEDIKAGRIHASKQDEVLSDEIIKNIEEGIADIKAGRIYTSEQVKKNLKL